MGELDGKVVLVTGATRGIGLGTAEVLAREGASVIVSSIESDEIHNVVGRLPGGAGRHHALLLDVTQPEARAAAFDVIRDRFGRLDGLVNNAGINFQKPFEETSFEDWRRVMTMDLDSVYDLSHRAITMMLPQGSGSIVNISSVHSLATIAGQAPYAAAKGAINLFSKGLAIEFAARGIRVNCVAPGLIKTEIWKDIVAEFGGDEAACMAYWRKNIPIGRIIMPQEIGEMVSFVLSDRARGITGSVFYVDGGMTSQLIASE